MVLIPPYQLKLCDLKNEKQKVSMRLGSYSYYKYSFIKFNWQRDLLQVKKVKIQAYIIQD